MLNSQVYDHIFAMYKHKYQEQSKLFDEKRKEIISKTDYRAQLKYLEVIIDKKEVYSLGSWEVLANFKWEKRWE